MSNPSPPLCKTALLGCLLTAATYPLFVASHTDTKIGIGVVAFFASLAGGLVFSVLGVIRIERSDGDLHGKPFAWLGILGLVPWAPLFIH